MACREPPLLCLNADIERQFGLFSRRGLTIRCLETRRRSGPLVGNLTKATKYLLSNRTRSHARPTTGALRDGERRRLFRSANLRA